MWMDIFFVFNLNGCIFFLVLDGGEMIVELNVIFFYLSEGIGYLFVDGLFWVYVF